MQGQRFSLVVQHGRHWPWTRHHLECSKYGPETNKAYLTLHTGILLHCNALSQSQRQYTNWAKIRNTMVSKIPKTITWQSNGFQWLHRESNTGARFTSPGPLYLPMSSLRYSSHANDPSSQSSLPDHIGPRPSVEGPSMRQTIRSITSKIYPSSYRSSNDHRTIIAALNRFGPFIHLNPFLLAKLAKIFKAYLTLTILGLVIIIYTFNWTLEHDIQPPWRLSTNPLALGGMLNWVANPYSHWMGDYYRMFTAPFVHLHYLHMMVPSGIFLAIGTAIELSAGPVALLALIIFSGIAGVTASYAAPERKPCLSQQHIQTGWWPMIASMIVFYGLAVRKKPATYILNSPFRTQLDRIHARQLLSTLSKRNVSLLVSLSILSSQFPFTNHYNVATMAGMITGATMGAFWPRSTFLALLSTVMFVGSLTAMAQAPTWNAHYQAYQVGRSWEDGEFWNAREWLSLLVPSNDNPTHPFKDSSTVLNPWTKVMLALTEMACGHIQIANDQARQISLQDVRIPQQLSTYDACRNQRLFRAWRQPTHNADQLSPSNPVVLSITVDKTNDTNNQDQLVPLHLTTSFASSASSQLQEENNFSSIRSELIRSKHNRSEIMNSMPWTIMNDNKVLHLYQQVFSPPIERDNQPMTISQNHKGLFALSKSNP